MCVAVFPLQSFSSNGSTQLVNCHKLEKCKYNKNLSLLLLSLPKKLTTTTVIAKQ